jgi:hypothetical protein
MILRLCCLTILSVLAAAQPLQISTLERLARLECAELARTLGAEAKSAKAKDRGARCLHASVLTEERTGKPLLLRYILLHRGYVIEEYVLAADQSHTGRRITLQALWEVEHRFRIRD